jgi:hypothetical protein
MGFVGALRFVASVVGVGRAPLVVDRWSRTLQCDRKEIRSAVWLTIFLAPLITLFYLIADGWGYIFPALLTATWLGLLWDYTLHRNTLVNYYRSFRERYGMAGKDDFACYAGLHWWRWQQLKWLFASRSFNQIVEILTILRVTDPATTWCRRDRWQMPSVLEARIAQYEAAYGDFGFRFRLWWTSLAARVLIWCTAASLVLGALILAGSNSSAALAAAAVSLGISVVAFCAFNIMGERTRGIRRRLATPIRDEPEANV